MRLGLVLAALAVALVGCGGEKLTGDEQMAVLEARVAFSNTVLDSSMYAETLHVVEMLIGLYWAKPEATVEQYEDPDITVRQAVIDAANTLRKYQPELAAKLEPALRD